MALTLPADLSKLPHEVVNGHFATLGRRFASKKKFQTVSVMWKRELQARGALHWHLVFYGLGDNPGLEIRVRDWIVAQWNELVCQDVTAEEREHHRWWHRESRWDPGRKRNVENWERVIDFAGYFAKYLGKDWDADQDEPIPGRWWGSWNKKVLPVDSPVELVLPEKVATDVHRVMRKLRQKRADEGRHRSLVRQLGNLASPFQSAVEQVAGMKPLSRWDLDRLRMGYTRTGRSGPVQALGGIPEAAFQRFVIDQQAKAAGVRFSKFRFKSAVPRTASMIALGNQAPSDVLRVLHWSYGRHGLSIPALLTREELGTLRAVKRPIRAVEQALPGLGGRTASKLSRAALLERGKIGPAYAGCGGD